METHTKVLGVLNIISGVLGLGLALVLVVVFGGVTALVGADADADAVFVAPLIGMAGMALVVFMVALSLPSVIIGWGLYQLRPWSRVAGIVLSIISLVSFPFGTLLGAYGLWVLFSKDGQRLFETAQTMRA
jgi:hypothetical protein